MENTKNKIVIGELNNPIITLDDRCIVRCDVSISCDVNSTDLPIDTVEIVVDSSRYSSVLLPLYDDDGIKTTDNKIVCVLDDLTNTIYNLGENAKIFVYAGEMAVGLFYVSDIKRVKVTQYEIKGQSIVGVMDTSPFYGDCYFEDAFDFFDRSAYSMIKWALTSKDCGVRQWNGEGTIPYGKYESDVPVITEFYNNYLIVDTSLKDVKLLGLVSSGTRRTALHQILYAIGYSFRKLPGNSFQYTIERSENIYAVNTVSQYENASVEIPDSVDAVAITVHKYERQVADQEILYDGVDFGDGYSIVDLGAPCCSCYGTDGLDVYKWCANAAIVSGCGKLYIRRAKDSRYVVTNNFSGKKVCNKLSLGDNGLISYLNAYKILNSFCEYYDGLQYHNIDAEFQELNAGCKHSFLNGYREPAYGILKEMSISLSNKTKASCKFASNFKTDFKFRNFTVLTDSGTWETPLDVLNSAKPALYVVVIGGGSGGGSGLKGTDGSKRTTQNEQNTNQNPPGSFGPTGNGGKIRTVSISGSYVQPSYDYICGSGGSGGGLCYDVKNSNAGSPGGDTLFGGYSSADGNRNTSGFMNPISGIIYGAKPENPYKTYNQSGYKSDSGEGGFYAWQGFAAHEWFNPDRPYWAGGSARSYETFNHNDGSRWAQFGVTYGDPGGGGVGETGKDPTAPQKASNGEITTGGGGNGGNSTIPPATPLQYDPTRYGWGGFGGYGGGGGGDAGFTAPGWPWGVQSGTPGVGGCGGPGGEGAPGCIIVFW